MNRDGEDTRELSHKYDCVPIFVKTCWQSSKIFQILL